MFNTIKKHNIIETLSCKKNRLFLTAVSLTVLLLCCLTSCEFIPTLSEDYSEQEVVKRSEEIIALVNASDFQALYDELTTTQQEKTTADAIRITFRNTVSSLGAFQKIEGYSVFGQKDADASLAVIVSNVIYEQGNIAYTLTFNTELKLVSIAFKETR